MSPSDLTLCAQAHTPHHIHVHTHVHTMLSEVKRGGDAAQVGGCLPSVQKTQSSPSTDHTDNVGIWKVLARLGIQGHPELHRQCETTSKLNETLTF